MQNTQAVFDHASLVDHVICNTTKRIQSNRGRPARKGYVAGREITVSPLFETQLRVAANNMNQFQGIMMQN
jgi:hypothetical protein